MTGKILIVDDEQGMCELLDTDLKLRGYESRWFTAAAPALQSMHDEEYDAVLTDLKMPGMSGLQLCEQIVANRPDIPVIVMTAFGSLETAVSAIRVGAFDFVTKPIEMELLAIALERAVNHRRLQEEVKRLKERVESAGRFGQIIGESPAMRTLFDQLARVADSESSILITGESGTGKELIAHSVHRNSRRAEAPFVPVNCAAIPATLLESELFGHTKGAFTDARTGRKGLFQQADQGTLFLDEIGEMPLAMQATLLRVLESGHLRPVGSDAEIPFDVRVLAATNRDLEAAVEDGRFREDLYFRVNVIQLDVPPLRARGTDVLLIAHTYLQTFSRRAGKPVKAISENAAEKLLAYAWPGNVRELRNVIERAVALTRYEQLAVEDLPDKIRNYRSDQVIIGGHDPAELVPMEEIERRYIRHVLNTVGGNKTTAARILGVDRKTLYRKVGADN